MTAVDDTDSSLEEKQAGHKLRDVAADAMHAVITPDRKQMLKHELRAYAGIALYLAACFSLLATVRAVVLIQHGINEFVHGYVVAIVEAVALGKVVLLAQNLRVLSAWEKRTLALSVLWKSFLMTIIVDIGGRIEGLIFHHAPAHTIHPTIFFIAHQLAFMFIFVVLFTARELDRDLGPGKLFNLCFGPREVRQGKSARTNHSPE